MARKKKEAPPVDLAPEEYAEVKPQLPAVLEHHPLGGSAAERYIACPGSVELIAQLRATGIPEEDPEYRQEGELAHKLAEHALRTGDGVSWAVMMHPDFAEVTSDMATAVGVYVDYVTGLSGQKEYEVRVKMDAEGAFGTIDCWRADDDEVETIDYKNGAGVGVSPAENPQLMFYTGAKIGLEPSGLYPDDLRVKLTIVQPNFYGVEPIRTWETTAGFIRSWIRNVLIPAMRRTREDKYLDVGEHCRFCPAKIICPAQTELVKTFAAMAPEMLQLLPDASLRRLCERAIPATAGVKAVKAEAYRRLMAGAAPEAIGMKLVEGRANRAWKDGAPVEAVLGENAFHKKLVSPAQAEKFGQAGKNLAKEYGYKPPGSPQVVPLDDQRHAIERKDIMTTFAAFAGKLPEDVDVGF